MRQDGGDGGEMGAKSFIPAAVRMPRVRRSLLLRATLQKSCHRWGVLDLNFCRGEEGKYSHRVGASAAVALLADDGRAEMLWVGERESVERLRRMQTAAAQRQNAKLNIGATKLK